jgi:uncharacterized protein (TIGR02246 family)
MSDHTADEHAITELLRTVTEAWGRGDADAFGSAFTEDASYTTWLGSRYQGRSDIVESHRALFDGLLKGTRLADEIERIRFHGQDTAVLTTRGDTYKGKPPKRLSKVQTYLAVRTAEGGWRFAAFQNTKRRALMEALSLRLAPRTMPAAARAGAARRPGR